MLGLVAWGILAFGTLAFLPFVASIPFVALLKHLAVHRLAFGLPYFAVAKLRIASADGTC